MPRSGTHPSRSQEPKILPYQVLYVPHTIIQSGWRGIRDDPLPIAAPVLVYYRGGGFVAGDLESQDSLLRALANRSQCVVISVAYRLAPENPYPAANDDAWAALTWVAVHASNIGADPQRLAVGGDSAGGLLAAWVAQKAAKNGPKLRLQVLLYPNLDATTSRPSWKELGTGACLVSHSQTIEWYDAYLPEGINRKAPEVSPLSATDLSGVAPAFIITADHDPLHDEADEYAAKLKAANVAVDHTCWPGMVRGLASLAGRRARRRQGSYRSDWGCTSQSIRTHTRHSLKSAPFFRRKHPKFQRPVPINEEGAAPESFPQHFEKSLNPLNIYENRLYQFPYSGSLQSNERTGSSASITQP